MTEGADHDELEPPPVRLRRSQRRVVSRTGRFAEDKDDDEAEAPAGTALNFVFAVVGITI